MLPPVFATLRGHAPAAALLQDRIYRHGDAPQGVNGPYVTWLVLSGIPENQLSGAPLVDRLPVQIDCWSLKDADVEQLATAVRDAIEPVAHMTNLIGNSREPDTKLYRIAMQFDWWLGR